MINVQISLSKKLLMTMVQKKKYVFAMKTIYIINMKNMVIHIMYVD